MYSVLETAEHFSGLAVAIIALVALIFAWIQIGAARSATAKEIYGGYLKLAFENPRLAIPPQDDNTLKADPKEYERYRWFVAFMMNACDEIASIWPMKKIWRNAICIDLGYHEKYLLSSDFTEDGGWHLYSRNLKEIGFEAGVVK